MSDSSMNKVCGYCMRPFDGPNKVYCSQACNRVAYDLLQTDPQRWRGLRKQAEELAAEWEMERAEAEGEARWAKELEPLIQTALDASPCHTAETLGGIVVTLQQDGSYHIQQFQLEGEYLDERFDSIADVARWVASDANYIEPDAYVWEPASRPLEPLDHHHRWQHDPNPARQHRDSPKICALCHAVQG